MAKQKLHTNTIELDLYYQLLLGVAPALECSRYIQDYFIGEKLTHLSLQVSIANSLFFWGSILCALPLLSVGTLFGLDLHRSYGRCTVSGVNCTSVVFCLEDTVSLQSVYLLQPSSPYHLSPLLPRSLSLGWHWQRWGVCLWKHPKVQSSKASPFLHDVQSWVSVYASVMRAGEALIYGTAGCHWESLTAMCP